MVVSICDDNSVLIEELKDTLNRDKRISQILTYNNPEQLVTDIKMEKNRMDTVFLDIEYGTDKIGLSYAKEIYKINKEINIIYMTGYHDKYDQEIFLNDANLVGYMTKPIDSKILNRYIDKIYEKNNNYKTLAITTKGKEHIINIDNIVYLESDNHRTLIHLEDEVLYIYEKLGSVEKRLPDSFIRCHKSFLVNMEKIRYIENESVNISESLSIPVSRSRKDEVTSAYFNYIGGKI